MTLPKYNELNTCHFVTTKVWQNIWLFKEKRYCQIIIDNLNFYRSKFGFKLIAYAILPWHLHLVLMLSKKWNDISKVMQDFKKFMAIQIVQQLIKDKKVNLLKQFSLTGKVEGYPSTLGLCRQAGSEYPAIPSSVGSLNFPSGIPRSSYWSTRVIRSSDSSLPAEWLCPYPLPGTPRSSDRDTNKLARSEDLAVPVKRRKYQIWLPDNYDFNIYSFQKLEQKVNYVNHNAVKHGLVKDPNDWKYSSFRNYEFNDHSIIKIDEID